MLIRAGVGIGFAGAEHKEVLSIPDDELAGKSEDEQSKVITSYLIDWSNNYLDLWHEPAEDGDEEGDGW